jgi:hypothetical protein
MPPPKWLYFISQAGFKNRNSSIVGGVGSQNGNSGMMLPANEEN